MKGLRSVMLPKPGPRKKKREPPRKKTKTRKLMQECDLLMRARIFDRDGHRCIAYGQGDVRCGEKAMVILQAAHILPKGHYPRMRFEADNLLTMCFYHHIIWAHKDPLDFARFVNNTYPGREERLREYARTAPKVNLGELLEELRKAP